MIPSQSFNLRRTWALAALILVFLLGQLGLLTHDHDGQLSATGDDCLICLLSSAGKAGPAAAGLPSLPPLDVVLPLAVAFVLLRLSPRPSPRLSRAPPVF